MQCGKDSKPWASKPRDFLALNYTVMTRDWPRFQGSGPKWYQSIISNHKPETQKLKNRVMQSRVRTMLTRAPAGTLRFSRSSTTPSSTTCSGTCRTTPRRGRRPCGTRSYLRRFRSLLRRGSSRLANHCWVRRSRLRFCTTLHVGSLGYCVVEGPRQPVGCSGVCAWHVLLTDRGVTSHGAPHDIASNFLE